MANFFNIKLRLNDYEITRYMNFSDDEGYNLVIS
jgi:hypothetical protein